VPSFLYVAIWQRTKCNTRTHPQRKAIRLTPFTRLLKNQKCKNSFLEFIGKP